MEIISYVLEGGLEHKDSLGTGSVIRPGDVQRMSAGTGVTHSEFNTSQTEVVHFLQIWMLPARTGIQPSYEQKAFAEAEQRNRLRVVASPDGRDGSLELNTDALLYAGKFDAGKSGELALAKGRHAWVQVARGEVRVNGNDHHAGDGAALSDEEMLWLEASATSEVLVFDLG
jgi:redox-sensitive bicupin YhaK (pirin superfamily)